MAINRNGFDRSVREFTIGGTRKVRELKALRALNETPYIALPEDQEQLSDLGHVEETSDGVRLSPAGRRRLVELENQVKAINPQKYLAPNLTTPPVGVLLDAPNALQVLPQPGSGLPTTRIPNVYRGALPPPGLPNMSATVYKK